MCVCSVPRSSGRVNAIVHIDSESCAHHQIQGVTHSHQIPDTNTYTQSRLDFDKTHIAKQVQSIPILPHSIPILPHSIPILPHSRPILPHSIPRKRLVIIQINNDMCW